MKVLVTGGCGFIGSNLVKALVRKGIDVVVIDDLSNSSLNSIKDLGVEFVKADITNENIIKKVVRGCDVVYHLGAIVGMSNCVKNPILSHKVNSNGTFNIAHSCLENDVKLIYTSTAGVYGDPQYLPVDENHPINPKNMYSATKYIGEIYCTTINANYVILRLFNVYGINQGKSPYSSVIPIFIKKALKNEKLTVYGDGNQIRDYMHVNDVVNALILAGKKDINGIFNIGSGKETSVNDLINIISEVSNKKLDIINLPERTWELISSVAKIDSAKKVLGFAPKVDIKTGLKEVFNYETEKLVE